MLELFDMAEPRRSTSEAATYLCPHKLAFFFDYLHPFVSILDYPQAFPIVSSLTALSILGSNSLVETYLFHHKLLFYTKTFEYLKPFVSILDAHRRLMRFACDCYLVAISIVRFIK